MELEEGGSEAADSDYSDDYSVDEDEMTEEERRILERLKEVDHKHAEVHERGLELRRQLEPTRTLGRRRGGQAC